MVMCEVAKSFPPTRTAETAAVSVSCSRLQLCGRARCGRGVRSKYGNHETFRKVRSSRADDGIRDRTSYRKNNDAVKRVSTLVIGKMQHRSIQTH